MAGAAQTGTARSTPTARRSATSGATGGPSRAEHFTVTSKTIVGDPGISDVWMSHCRCGWWETTDDGAGAAYAMAKAHAEGSAPDQPPLTVARLVVAHRMGATAVRRSINLMKTLTCPGLGAVHTEDVVVERAGHHPTVGQRDTGLLALTHHHRCAMLRLRLLQGGPRYVT